MADTTSSTTLDSELDTITKRSQTESPLLCLPAELRNKINSFLLESATVEYMNMPAHRAPAKTSTYLKFVDRFTTRPNISSDTSLHKSSRETATLLA
ncbi:hypothetical protein EKO04_008524 [Ascochyta lentis]|uniref:Uncharacterized protein n=1 Tax=Ascochyta lentis TaxID=205686 RepID=A0A8H7J221_9PLEO|nr:hypothetical protein EKO04_008524 [Ascochyta lentis]